MTGFITRREALALGAGFGALGLSALPALAQQRFFRIGTGGTGGTYYPVGGMIANAVSTDKINVSAVATNGSVANVNGIVGGSMESGFSQADINAWAYTGTGIYEGKPKIEELRVIANLFPESVHVVVRKGLGIKSLADLKGKRVSIDEPGSGTLVNARALLAAYGVTERDIRPEYLKQVQSAEKLKDGSLDGYFQTTGYPAGHALRTCRHQRLRASADRWSRARQDHGAVQILRQGHDPGRHLQGRQGRRDRRGRRAVDDIRPSSPTISSTRSPRRYGATRRAPRSTPATPRARRFRKRPRWRVSASRCMPAPRNSTRKSAC